MDGMPTPINPALLKILANSKQVMNKVEEKKPISKNANINETKNESFYNENDEKDFVYEQKNINHNVNLDYNEEMVRNSKLPDNIKQLMIKHPIKQSSFTQTKFTAEDIEKINGTNKEVIQEQRLTGNSDMITISKSELKDMINEGISTFFKQIYDKTLTEETIKKTINLLIKEGKINVKK